jgi:molybdenum cofactor cytidylyltransferase
MQSSKPERALSLGVVILAAGASIRMGQPKLLLPWGPTSILGHQIETWRKLATCQVAVVCSAADQALHAELYRLRFPMEQRILNPTPHLGMFHSIKCAASWVGWAADTCSWAIVLGDQPQIRFETLRTLLQFAARHAGRICQPSQGDRRCHPVLIPRATFEQLGQATEATLREFLEGREVALCPMADPGLDLDIDHPEDYRRAVSSFPPTKRGAEKS